MKNYLYSFILTIFFTSPVIADTELKIRTILKDIKTVEDVQDVRNQLIDILTERLDSGELTPNQVSMFEQRIVFLSNKPLPTQEQIDWRIKKSDQYFLNETKIITNRKKFNNKKITSVKKCISELIKKLKNFMRIFIHLNFNKENSI